MPIRGREDELKQISKQLAEIQNKLQEMDNKLDEVLSELRALKIKIDETPDLESRKRVNALTAVIVKDFSTWTADPRKYSAEIHMISLNLEVETENLMSRKTYGNFETVAFAMFLQRSMFLLLKASPQLQYQHYAGFEQYFKDATSPEVDGSVGREKKMADSRLDEVTKYLTPGVPFLCQVSGWFHHCCGEGKICDYYNFQDVAGDLSSGYTLIGAPYEVKIAGPGGYGQCSHHGEPGGHGGRTGKLVTSPSGKPSDSIAPAGASDEDKLSSLLDENGAAKSGASGATAESSYFAGLAMALLPPSSPEVYGLPGVAACPAQLNPLKAELDALLTKTEALRQTLPIASKFQGIAAKLKEEARVEMQFAE